MTRISETVALLLGIVIGAVWVVDLVGCESEINKNVDGKGGGMIRVETRRRSARHRGSCRESLEMFISDFVTTGDRRGGGGGNGSSDRALMVLTARVESLLHVQADGILTTSADTDIDGYEWIAQIQPPSPSPRSPFSQSKQPDSMNSNKVNLSEKGGTTLEKQVQNQTSTRRNDENLSKESVFLDKDDHDDDDDQNNLEIRSRRSAGRFEKTVSNTRLGAQVKVKRVIRGDRSFENTLIVIDGLNGLKGPLCQSRLRVRDTRIFVLDVNPDGTLTLAFPPLPVTLDNLRELGKLQRQQQLLLPPLATTTTARPGLYFFRSASTTYPND